MWIPGLRIILLSTGALKNTCGPAVRVINWYSRIIKDKQITIQDTLVIKSNQIKFIFSDISNIFTILQIYIFNHINIHNINDDMFKGFEILK